VKDNFKANFLIFSKSNVNGADPNPVFGYLRNHSELYDPVTKTAKVIPWNFAKFLVNRSG
jgi:glutathione peroxidase-family protein